MCMFLGGALESSFILSSCFPLVIVGRSGFMKMSAIKKKMFWTTTKNIFTPHRNFESKCSVPVCQLKLKYFLSN